MKTQHPLFKTVPLRLKSTQLACIVSSMLYRNSQNSQHTPQNPKPGPDQWALSTQERRPTSGEPNATRKATRLRASWGLRWVHGSGIRLPMAYGFGTCTPAPRNTKIIFGEHLARNVPEEECTKAKSTTMVY